MRIIIVTIAALIQIFGFYKISFVSASSHAPSFAPTSPPSYGPTSAPSVEPSFTPTSESQPSHDPTSAPSVEPSFTPTSESQPSHDPTSAPSVEPSFTPTLESPPSYDPTFAPSVEPSFSPTLDSTVTPTSTPSIEPSTQLSTEPTFGPTNPSGNSFLTTQTLYNVTVNTLSSANGTLALRITILKSLNDSTIALNSRKLVSYKKFAISLDEIVIVNITAAPVGSGVITNYLVFIHSNTPKAAYDKLIASLSNSIISGTFTTTLRSIAQQLNVPNMSNVNTDQANISPLEFVSPPTIAPSFIPSKISSFIPSKVPSVISSTPSNKPVYTYPSNKPVYKYPSHKPIYKYPSIKPVYKYPSAKPAKSPTHKPVYKYPSNKPIEYKKPSSKPLYHYPSRKPVYKYPTSKPVNKPENKNPTKKPTRKPSDHNNQNIGDTAAAGGATTQESGSLSVGVYAGIALAGVVLLGLLIYAGIWYWKKSQTKNTKVVSLSEGNF